MSTRRPGFTPFLASVVLAGMLYSSDGYAADWAGALPQASVESYLSGTGLKVLVAAAGENNAELDSATQALTAALRATGRVKLVMTDDALGDLSALDDAAIVAKAKNLPIDQVFVARVFPADKGAWSTVVTMYKKDGATIEAFVGATNEPLTARSRSENTSAGAGVSTAAAAALQSAGTAVSKSRQSAIEDYEKRAIYSENWAAVDAYSGAVRSTWTQLYKGKYKEPLKGGKLYSYLGRDDLAKKYRSRAAINLTSFGVGLAGVIGGTSWATSALSFYADDPDSECYEYIDYDEDYNEVYGPDYDDCTSGVRDRNEAGRSAQQTALIGGGTVFGVGFVALMVPVFHKTHPVAAPEVRQMVDEYNANLRKELGLEEAGASGTYGSSYQWSLSAGPWVKGDMVGGTVRVTF